MVGLTILSASNSSAQRLPPAGGAEQAVATNSACCLPDSLRAVPGRDTSVRGASRLPSTKQRLVQYTVERPTDTLAAIAASVSAVVAASGIYARFTLRAARLPPRSMASSWSRSA